MLFVFSAFTHLGPTRKMGVCVSEKQTLPANLNVETRDTSQISWQCWKKDQFQMLNKYDDEGDPFC